MGSEGCQRIGELEILLNPAFLIEFLGLLWI